MWVITVNAIHREGEWVTSIPIPTFFLDESVQGFGPEGPSEHLVRNIVDPLKRMESIHFTAAKVD